MSPGRTVTATQMQVPETATSQSRDYRMQAHQAAEALVASTKLYVYRGEEEGISPTPGWPHPRTDNGPRGVWSGNLLRQVTARGIRVPSGRRQIVLNSRS